MTAAIEDLIRKTTSVAPGAFGRRPPPPADWREQADALAAAWQAAGYDNRHELLEPLSQWTILARTRSAHKGIIIYGNPGLGKTAGLRMVAAGLGVPLYDAQDLTRSYQHATDRDQWLERMGRYAQPTDMWADVRCRQALIIDDIGTEPESVVYGQHERVVAAILRLRWRAFEEHAAYTVLATNLTRVRLAEAYSAAVLDRIDGLCKPLVATGESSRRTQ